MSVARFIADQRTKFRVPHAVSGQAGYGWLGARERGVDSASGLMLMGARIYNPASGRFTSTDPFVGGNETAYTYSSDPVNQVDLTGEWTIKYKVRFFRLAWQIFAYGSKTDTIRIGYLGGGLWGAGFLVGKVPHPVTKIVGTAIEIIGAGLSAWALLGMFFGKKIGFTIFGRFYPRPKVDGWYPFWWGKAKYW